MTETSAAARRRLPAAVLGALLGALVLALGWFAAPEARAQQPGELAVIGHVTRVQGNGLVLRGTREFKAEPKLTLARRDVLKTAAGARLLVTFEDGSQFTVGENAEVVLDDFLYKPRRRNGVILLDVIKGAFRFTTGKLGQLTDKRIEVHLPAASLAVRGTDFWGGPIDRATGVLLIDGEVEVRNAAGVVILSDTYAGTMVGGRFSAPDRPVTWGREKINRAIASISFR
jgi:hypothetical protein